VGCERSEQRYDTSDLLVLCMRTLTLRFKIPSSTRKKKIDFSVTGEELRPSNLCNRIIGNFLSWSLTPCIRPTSSSHFLRAQLRNVRLFRQCISFYSSLSPFIHYCPLCKNPVSFCLLLLSPIGSPNHCPCTRRPCKRHRCISCCCLSALRLALVGLILSQGLVLTFPSSVPLSTLQ
jgi:hypothetical protein